MRARRCLLLLLVALWCVAPGVAAGAPSPTAAGVVVATDGPASLTVRDAQRTLCVALSKGDDGTTESCGEDGTGAVTIGAPPGSSGLTPARFLGAAVPATATRVEVRRAGKLLATGPTVAGEAYRGRRARTVRFALLRLPSNLREDGLRVRAVAADGASVEAFGPGESDLVTDRRVLLSGRSGSTRWSVVSQRVSSLSSTLFDPDHETVTRCLEVRVKGPRSSSRSGGRCTGAAPQDAALESAFAGLSTGAVNAASTEDVCNPRFRLLHGVVSGSGAEVTALLGDGRRLRARSRPFAEAGETAYALVIPKGSAVRSVRVRRPGAASRTLGSPVPPLAVSCASGSPESDFVGGAFDPIFDTAKLLNDLPAVTPAGPVTSVPGSPGFRVADGPADSLCVAVSDRPFTGLSCAIVPPGFAETVGSVDDFRRPRAFVIAVPAQVARVRFGPKDGPARELPTVAGEGYAGRYAGRVRFVAATITSFRDFQRMQLLDAAGKVLHTETDDTSAAALAAPKVSAPRRIAGERSRPSLWETPVRAAGRTTRCLALTRGRPPKAGSRCRAVRSGALTAIVAASCATRRLTLAIVAARGSRVSLQRGSGAALALPLRGGAAVVTLPPTSALRSLTVERRGKRTLRVPVQAPTASSQCGWDAVLSPLRSERGLSDSLR